MPIRTTMTVFQASDFFIAPASTYSPTDRSVFPRENILSPSAAGEATPSPVDVERQAAPLRGRDRLVPRGEQRLRVPSHEQMAAETVCCTLADLQCNP